MATFEAAIPVLLKHEGGYVNDPDDPGGETNFGITKRSYPDLDIKNLTQDQATAIYRRDWWNPLYSQINSQAVATKLFDLSVNMGKSWPVRCLQRAVGVSPDGAFGPQTLAAVNAAGDQALTTFIDLLIARHARIAFKRNKWKFLKGWIERDLS